VNVDAGTLLELRINGGDGFPETRLAALRCLGEELGHVGGCGKQISRLSSSNNDDRIEML
jgi:hypothetical protein